MKKLLFSLGVALLMSTITYAQTNYGIKAGLNLPKIQLTSDAANISYTSDASTSFYIGGYANAFVSPNFAIQPGLSLQGKGGKVNVNDFAEGAPGSGTIQILSVEIPVNAVYYIPTGTVGSVFIGAGPYLGCNLSAKAKSGNFSQDINIGSGREEMKRIDYGANFLGGYKLSSGLLFNVGYGLGIANMDNTSDPIEKNRVLSFGIGFEF